MDRSFHDSERNCEFTFENAVRRTGPFWHIYTPGLLSEIINITPEDFKFSVTNMAISACEAGVVIVTDAHMENHLHILAGCPQEKCTELLDRYLYREKLYLSGIGRSVNLSKFRCDDPVRIDSLNTMRNEIVYINRNGYVANRAYTPFSYPWGGGYLYFNLSAQKVEGVKYNDLQYDYRRSISRKRVALMPDSYTWKEGMVLPSGYINYKLGESFFRDAHHYFNLLSRNYEAFSEEAGRLGDTIVLSSEELYPAVKLICQNRYGVSQPGMLAPAAKLEVAKVMHSDYHATNAQIQRILGLDRQYVDMLFPLHSKK